MQLQTKNNFKGPFLAEVLENISLSSDIWKLTFKNLTIAKNAKPGQFVSVLCKDLVLRRPFSIANTYDDCFEVIYKVKGSGTKFMSCLKTGSFADVIGAFGNGFSFDNSENSLLIGCGVGIAPVSFLSAKFADLGIKHTFAACTQTYLESFTSSVKVPHASVFITEDGSQGFKGRLDDYLEKIIEDIKPKKIYTCGPNAAMAYICDVAKKYNISTEVALEREFACGTGVCMGCVIQVNQKGNIVNKRICKDGPVFNGAEILW